MQAHNPRHGIHTYHSHKQRVLGNPAAQPAPAWRANAKAASGSGPELGSKILLSRLPTDVVENEVEVLFSRTVGPVKEVLMVYNSQGKSRGMAVVAFARPGDAAVARAKYNGKIVDGRRPIKIEIVSDEDTPRSSVPAVVALPGQPSLLARLAKPTPAQAAAAASAPPQNGRKVLAQVQVAAVAPVMPSPRNRVRQKRGAGRLKKQRAQQGQQPQTQHRKQKSKTREELDAEMEDYRANGPSIKISESILQ
ncbi:hypothetical protein GSI_14853 [Ganoderma sinense ZZ0214-1]|uniref:RRM domain-containing protein n=1 Tax=Ganoderma sinense ZZ0214-1 TaxID=1077348 RepID=A0A2G8RPV2_9APHY|nr:hypothetical protein GSI_14853 [Ganoderma sinense ZZ0214-1]